MNVIVYTTHCPQCEVLEKKLKAKNIAFTENTNKDEMLQLGFTSVPMVKVEDKILAYAEAIKWINSFTTEEGVNNEDTN